MRDLWYVLHGYGQLAAPFLEDLRAIDDGSRLIVAPEALSRFYDGDLPARLHKDAKVGASWMTREDREAEIADYVAYLDAVHQSIARPARRRASASRSTVLGFSQGGATAARWVAGGRVNAARLVVWGSQFPPELDLADPGAPLRRAETVLVIGIDRRVRDAEDRREGTGAPRARRASRSLRVVHRRPPHGRRHAASARRRQCPLSRSRSRRSFFVGRPSPGSITGAACLSCQ